MNTRIEELFQSIGLEAVRSTDSPSGPILIYCEVEEGVVSADLLYQETPGARVHFRFCPQSIRNLIYELWKVWMAEPAQQEWRILCFFVKDGKFSVDFTYPGDVSDKEGLFERRPRAVARYFDGATADFTRQS